MEYKEFRKKGLQQTGVWLYFLKAVDGKSAKCKKCDKILKAEGGTTSSLRSHIRAAHGITFESGSTEQDENQLQVSQPTKKSKIQDYFKTDQSMEMIVSRMVCLDGLTFRVFANSVDLRRLFLKSGHQLPSSANTIRNIVLQRCEFVKQQTSQALTKLKLKGLLFSITMDEWTSSANKRYINVNIHSPAIENMKHFYNVGLIRIRGSATSTRCAELLNERLQSFGLSIEDIVGLSTDAASVMQKMGRSLPAYHQLCYAHGLQLAILDVLYKNQPVMCFESEDSESEFSGADADGEDNDSDDDEGFIIESPRRRVPISNTSCKSVIEKVRKVCKMFRRSPTKNETLQKYVKLNFDKEINLMLDCKTRWSSLASMLERFIKLYSCVQLALCDVKSEISFSTDEVELIKHVHVTLDIFKGSLEILCENDATLLTADVVLKYLLKELKKATGPLSAAFITALRKRIGERYLLIQGILKYLDNPDDFYNEADVDNIFIRPSQNDIVSMLVSLLGKSTESTAITTLDTLPETSTSSENIEPVPSTSGTSGTGSSVSASVKDLLRQELKKKTTRHEAEKTPIEVLQEQLCPNVIRIEMALHESGGTRGRYLEMAYRTLLSIKPTSVECERTFSTAGYLCSKFRSRMNDDTLNALIILKHYFIATNK